MNKKIKRVAQITLKDNNKKFGGPNLPKWHIWTKSESCQLFIGLDNPFDHNDYCFVMLLTMPNKTR